MTTTLALSSIKRNGIKVLNNIKLSTPTTTAITTNNTSTSMIISQPSTTTINSRSIFTGSKFKNVIWRKELRMLLKTGCKDYQISKVYINDEISRELDSPESKKLLEYFNTPREKHLSTIESENVDIMKTYYKLLGQESPKSLGTILLSGFDNESGIRVIDIATDLLNNDMLHGVERTNKFIVIHCERNNDDITFYEEFNMDGSRNFKKIFNVEKIQSKLIEYNENAAKPTPVSSHEFLYSSPTTDNFTLIIPPTFQFLDRIARNDLISRYSHKYVRESFGHITYIPVVSGNKPYLFSENEISLVLRLDRYSVSTIPILTDRANDTILRSILSPEKPINYFKKGDINTSLELRNRLYKIFFRSNEEYFKNFIEKKFNRSQTIAKLFSEIKVSPSLNSEDLLDKFAQTWRNQSIALKIHLIKKIENQILKLFLESTKKISFFENNNDEDKEAGLEPGVKETKPEPDFMKIFNNVEELSKKSTDKSGIDVLDYKNEWLFMSERLRGSELTNHYRSSFLEEYRESFEKFKEQDAIAVESLHYHYYISWNRSYRAIVSSLLNSDLLNEIKQDLVYNSIDCIEKYAIDDIHHPINVNPLFYLRHHASEFQNSLSIDAYKTMVSKEFAPSVTFEEFRESILEIFKLNNIDSLQIKAFSKLWYFIYLNALSKKIATNLVNLSFNSVIVPFISKAYISVIKRQLPKGLTESILEDVNDLEYIKKMLDLK